MKTHIFLLACALALVACQQPIPKPPQESGARTYVVIAQDTPTPIKTPAPVAVPTPGDADPLADTDCPKPIDPLNVTTNAPYTLYHTPPALFYHDKPGMTPTGATECGTPVHAAPDNHSLVLRYINQEVAERIAAHTDDNKWFVMDHGGYVDMATGEALPLEYFDKPIPTATIVTRDYGSQGPFVLSTRQYQELTPPPTDSWAKIIDGPFLPYDADTKFYVLGNGGIFYEPVFAGPDEHSGSIRNYRNWQGERAIGVSLNRDYYRMEKGGWVSTTGALLVNEKGERVESPIKVCPCVGEQKIDR